MNIRKDYIAVPTLLAMGIAGCAGGAFTKEDLDQTRRSVAQAEQSGIDQSGAIALETAKDKMARAEKALEDGEEEQAQRLANEARVDAEFAVAVSQAQSAQRAASELSASLESLRRETQRRQSGGAVNSQPPAVSPPVPAAPSPPTSRGQ